ncbi:DoxX family protein [Aggregatimonas sangjinii]|uniref:DoxX family protein n=1 Tax=Aggregatimonas sangjinii TaxID=2583587 RepID=A0A5B7SRB9_9FLAO|nr:DoxX family protein [Aggregatimonas sangjinii]QCW99479.1 DoxX family protein [Aggregatimonas sangjinii]
METPTLQLNKFQKWMKQLLHTKVPHGRPDVVLLVYRIAISMAFLFIHGLKKILNFQEEVQHIPDPFNMGGYTATIIAIFSNVICSIFIAMGLFTRVFALGAFMIPFIGLTIVHANDPWVVKDVPLMYSLAFLVIIVLGPGKYSADRIISKLWFKEKNY